MANVRLGERSVLLEPSETVLDGLLRCGTPVAFSCKAGVCQSCLLRLNDELSPDTDVSFAQAGLSETMRAQGYFLSCRLLPSQDVSVRMPDTDDCAFPATLVKLQPLSQSVLQVRLRVPREFRYRAGQYVTLLRPDGLARCYSIANRPSPDHSIELHVRRIRNGRMSGWLWDQAMVGDPMLVRGPAGNCFYEPCAEPDARPLLLAGTGTGLAPLYGILQDALVAGHKAPIWLFHGATQPEGLYLRPELEGLSQIFPRFQYVPALQSALGDRIEQELPDLTGFRAYLCGDPAVVAPLQEHVFLSGVASSDIFADPFLPTAA